MGATLHLKRYIAHGRRREGGIVEVHTRLDETASIVGHGRRGERILSWVFETGVLTAEGEKDVAGGSLTVLGNDDLGHSVKVVAFLVFIDVVVFRAVDEEHHVGILLDGSRLAQVAKLGALAFDPLAVFDISAQLREGDDGDVELLSQSLQRATDGGHFLLSATEFHAVGVHELKIVDHDDADVLLANEPTGFGAELEDGKTGGVVDVDLCALKMAEAFVEAVPLVGRKLSVENLAAHNLADIRDQTVDAAIRR